MRTIFFARAKETEPTDAQNAERQKRLKILSANEVEDAETSIEELRQLVYIADPFVVRDKEPAYIHVCKWVVDDNGNSLTGNKTVSKLLVDENGNPLEFDEPIVVARQKVRDPHGITATFTLQTLFDYNFIGSKVILDGQVSANYCAAVIIAETLNDLIFSQLTELNEKEAAPRIDEVMKLLQNKILLDATIRGKTEKRFLSLITQKCKDLAGKWKKPEQPAKLQNAVISASQRALIASRENPETDTTAATLDALKGQLEGEEREKTPTFFALRNCNGIKTSLLICLGAALYNHPEWVEMTKDKKAAYVAMTPAQILGEMGFVDSLYMRQKVTQNAVEAASMTFVADEQDADGKRYCIAGSPFIFQADKEKRGEPRWSFLLATQTYVLPGMEKQKSADYIKVFPRTVKYINSHAPNLPTGETAVNIASMILSDMARRRVDDAPLAIFGYEPPPNRMALSRFRKDVIPLIVDGIRSAGGVISITQDLKVTAHFPSVLAELKEKSEKQNELKAKKQSEQKSKTSIQNT